MGSAFSKLIIVSDLKSSYSATMYQYTFADGGRMVRAKIDSHEIGLVEFSVYVPENCPVPPLPYRSDGKRLFFPVARFTGWWTYAEVRHGQETIPGFRILSEKTGEGTNHVCHPFRDLVNEFFSERQGWQKKLKRDLCYREAMFKTELLKLRLNNLHGKAVQRLA